MSAQVRLGWQLEAEIAEKMAPVMYAVSIIGVRRGFYLWWQKTWWWKWRRYMMGQRQLHWKSLRALPCLFCSHCAPTPLTVLNRVGCLVVGKLVLDGWLKEIRIRSPRSRKGVPGHTLYCTLKFSAEVFLTNRNRVRCDWARRAHRVSRETGNECPGIEFLLHPQLHSHMCNEERHSYSEA